jgi:hypothetical protein
MTKKFSYKDDFFGFFKPTKGGTFYVYLLLRPNDQPFYVGKGIGDRIGDHEREARKGHECHRCRVIRKIWRNGGEVGRQIIFHTDNEQEAYRIEAATIARFRNKLVNHLDRQIGWHGNIGVPTPAPRMTAARRRDQINRALEKIHKRERKLADRLRYLRFGGSADEKREIQAELDRLDQLTSDIVWPPKQQGLWSDDTL